MKKFYDLKIAVKLIIGFVIVSLIAGVVGGVGVININKINTLDTEMYEKHTATLDDMAMITQCFERTRGNLRDLLIREDLEGTQSAIKGIENFHKIINESMTNFAVGMIDPREKESFQNLKSNIAQYDQITQKVINLVNENKKDDAIALFYGDGKVLSTKVQENVDELLKIKVEEAKESSETNDETSRNSSIEMFIIIAIGMLLAIVLGIVIARIISNPIKRLVNSADRIADGDINIVMEASTKDEIGSLNDAFSKVVTSLRNLVEEQVTLNGAAAEGRLEVRGNADKFKGSYKEIILGVNNTLDAVIKPINEASEVLNEIAHGNLKVKVTGEYKGDHAAIKNSVNSMVDIISSYINEISEVLTEMSEGNMDLSVTRDYIGDFIEIKNSLNKIIDSFNNVLNDINNSSQQVASGAKQVSDSSQALSQGSTEQASSVEELTASLEEISTQTKQNAVNADDAKLMALDAKRDAEVGNVSMREMLTSMKEINEASSNISKIIKVIDEIAFQTNILALNAAVEAARAGQHGKGFAVVAEEVRNLAARSANAAKETTVLIEGSIKKVEDGTKIADETAVALNKIMEIVTKVSNLVGEIANASNEQATGIAQVNQGIMQVSQVIQTNSATSEESASASEELSAQAELLKELVSKFNLKKKKANYNNLQGINNDVLTMLENMARNNGNHETTEKSPKLSGSKTKINLSDIEFGKY
jgi:methyl-accepting chemotaxis protein